MDKYEVMSQAELLLFSFHCAALLYVYNSIQLALKVQE